MVTIIFVPTGVTKLPDGFGSSKNGKVNAGEWHNLFAIYLPLTFVDLFFGLTHKEELVTSHRDLIANTCTLVHCTNAVSSKQVCEDDCKLFEKKVQALLQKLKELLSAVEIKTNSEDW
ncbi:hypothetical protein VP01_1272g1 [Puccinia sorghi]|uniref:Uncharacterized protein n=1 Tax=Puccinia sorghi TaxID=27349 RepID=A0A0L6VNW4_9BASI|nr:hypothetical protein VP01_1272g1 [Puccinia sorghi]